MGTNVLLMSNLPRKAMEIVFSPEDCTDICAVNNHHLGKLVKDDIHMSYKRDFAANRAQWLDGTINSRARRIKFTFWLAEAWVRLQAKQETIAAAFLACGVLGVINGEDDHLLQVAGEKDYKVELYDTDSEDESDDPPGKMEMKKKNKETNYS